MNSRPPSFSARAVLAACLLSACATQPPPPSRRSDPFPIPEGALVVETRGRFGGTLHYALAGEPSSFNPLAASEARSRLLTGLTSATLLEFDPVEQSIREGICSRWFRQSDGRTWILELREGARFSDGEPLGSEDVLFTFEKIYREDSNNVLRGSLLVDGQPLRVEAVNERTVRIEFPRTHAGAEFLMTTIPVLPRHKFGSADRPLEQYWGLDTAPAEMAGAGPFVIFSHTPAESTVLRFNPHYWKTDSQGRRLPYLDRIVLHYVEERNNRFLRFRAGELDLLDQLLAAEDYGQLSAREYRLQDAGPSTRLTFLWFNQNTGRDPGTGKPYLSAKKKEWFTDVRFRRAVSAALSRGAVVENVYRGQATPAWTLLPRTVSRWHLDLSGGAAGQRPARRLLAEAGFSWRRQGASEVLVDGRGRPLELEILTGPGEDLGRTAAVIQQDLEQLGIRTSVRQQEMRAVISRLMASRDYDAALMNVEIPVEPVDQMNMLHSSGPMHMWNPGQQEPGTDWERELDALMLEQARSLDPAARRERYNEVQRLLREQMPLIPLVHRNILTAARLRVRNLKPVSIYPYAFWNVWELWVENPAAPR